MWDEAKHNLDQNEAYRRGVADEREKWLLKVEKIRTEMKIVKCLPSEGAYTAGLDWAVGTLEGKR